MEQIRDGLRPAIRASFKMFESLGVSGSELDAYVNRYWIRIIVTWMIMIIELYYVWSVMAVLHSSKSSGLFGLIYIVVATAIGKGIFEAGRLVLGTLADEAVNGGPGGGGGH